PLGVMLPNGMVFAVDDKKPKQYPFAFCSNVGCVARVGFTALELESLRSGSNGKITIRMINNPGQPIDIGLSLKGFSAAFAALSKKILEEKQGQ
ncbi:MAG: invasion associated locus B family protein, partial [Paracoccaceae bacterium]